MKIIVGSQNAAKMSAAEKGVRVYWPNAEISGVEVESGVPGQPMGLEQTMQGAINRAKAAFEAAPGNDIAIGMEGGVMEAAGRMVLFNVVAAYDGTQLSAVPGVGVPLPDAWGKALLAGEELGPFMAKKFPGYTRKIGTMPLLTNEAIQRDDAFAQAVKGALAPWVNPAAFQDDIDPTATGGCSK